MIVVRDEVRVVNVQKGGKRESYNCTPQCNPSLVVGDDHAYFDSVVRAASERKIKFSEGQADQGQTAQSHRIACGPQLNAFVHQGRDVRRPDQHFIHAFKFKLPVSLQSGVSGWA